MITIEFYDYDLAGKPQTGFTARDGAGEVITSARSFNEVLRRLWETGTTQAEVRDNANPYRIAFAPADWEAPHLGG